MNVPQKEIDKLVAKATKLHNFVRYQQRRNTYHALSVLAILALTAAWCLSIYFKGTQ